jgi:hypothetical protein
MIIDGFLGSFEELKRASQENEFGDVENPYDGVVYPLISRDIPYVVEHEILSKLERALGRPAENHTIFMRRSPKGVNAPHQVHSDISMGKYSMMLYINEGEGAGTSFVKHNRTGIAYNPADEHFVRIVNTDQKKIDAWEIVDFVDAVPNRAFVFEADRLHRAEPVGGFGEGTEARVVLTCFFS